MRCENCGLPDGALSNDGVHVEIVRRAENRMQKDRKSTVWCCTDECAVQAAGISKYGVGTHKWPVTLNQFRTLYNRRQK